MVQGIAYGILHVYNGLIDDPVTCRHRSRTDALLLLRQALYLSSSSSVVVQLSGLLPKAHSVADRTGNKQRSQLLGRQMRRREKAQIAPALAPPAAAVVRASFLIFIAAAVSQT